LANISKEVFPEKENNIVKTHFETKGSSFFDDRLSTLGEKLQIIKMQDDKTDLPYIDKLELSKTLINFKEKYGKVLKQELIDSSRIRNIMSEGKT